ncbi:branched-chain amino acid ABC transporter permease [Ramlibacter sp.]|uniref:branched-chain amino acid ABC transporter permease n=1 Tax=Ramlibacter sp. TaxID=1917967 RepID=UPI003D0BFFAF
MKPRYLPLAAIAVAGAAVPFVLSEYRTSVATQILFACVGAYSLWLMMRINLLSLGHAAFMGVGAYTTAILCVTHGWSFWATVPVAGLAAAVAALLFGVITLRLSGIYFAMMSFVLLEMFQGLLRQADDYTGGQSGISGVPRPGTIALGGWEIDFSKTENIYWLTLVLTLLTLGFVVWLTGSRTGLRLKLIAASEKLAESAGVSVFKHRLAILGSSAFILGVCGPLVATFTRLASPSSYSLHISIDWLVYAAVGARFGTYGPALVAIVLVALTQIVFTQMGIYRVVLYGVILILAVMVRSPSGEAGGASRWLRRVRAGGRDDAAPKEASQSA